MRITQQERAVSEVIGFDKYKSSKTMSQWRASCAELLAQFDHPLFKPFVQTYLHNTVEYLHHINRLTTGALPFCFNLQSQGPEAMRAEFLEGHAGLYFKGEDPVLKALRPVFGHLSVRTMTKADKEAALGEYAYSTEDADDAIMTYLRQWEDLEREDGMSPLMTLPLLITVYVLGDSGQGFKIHHVHGGTRHGPHPFLRIQATHHKGVSLEFEYHQEVVANAYRVFRGRERTATRQHHLYMERRAR